MYVIIQSSLIECPWCEKAKQAATNYKKSYCVISLDSLEQKSILMSILNRYFNINESNISEKTGCKNGRLTFPQILHLMNSELVVNDLKELINILEDDNIEVEYIGGASAYILKLELENSN